MKPAFVIVGMGNPGAQYEQTRHNVGFWAVDELAKDCGTGNWSEVQKLLAWILEGRLMAVPMFLVKPTTFVNNSGNSVRKILDFYKLEPSQLLVICDDIDQKVGEMKIDVRGGPGTHNGLRSIVNAIGEEFPRVRIGIRGMHAPEGSFQKAGEDLAAYVLSRPPAEDKELIDRVLTKLPDTVRRFVGEGERENE